MSSNTIVENYNYLHKHGYCLVLFLLYLKFDQFILII